MEEGILFSAFFRSWILLGEEIDRFVRMVYFRSNEENAAHLIGTLFTLHTGKRRLTELR